MTSTRKKPTPRTNTEKHTRTHKKYIQFAQPTPTYKTKKNTNTRHQTKQPRKIKLQQTKKINIQTHIPKKSLA